MLHWDLYLRVKVVRPQWNNVDVLSKLGGWGQNQRQGQDGQLRRVTLQIQRQPQQRQQQQQQQRGDAREERGAGQHVQSRRGGQEGLEGEREEVPASLLALDHPEGAGEGEEQELRPGEGEGQGQEGQQRPQPRSVVTALVSPETGERGLRKWG